MAIPDDIFKIVNIWDFESESSEEVAKIDVINVSNNIDNNYVSIRDILTKWSSSIGNYENIIPIDTFDYKLYVFQTNCRKLITRYVSLVDGLIKNDNESTSIIFSDLMIDSSMITNEIVHYNAWLVVIKELYLRLKTYLVKNADLSENKYFAFCCLEHFLQHMTTDKFDFNELTFYELLCLQYCQLLKLDTNVIGQIDFHNTNMYQYTTNIKKHSTITTYF